VSPFPFRSAAAGESSRAYAAFTLYRDLGPARSQQSAWREHLKRAGRGEETISCPRTWQDWSSKFEWVGRAAAYDQEIDAQRLKARIEKTRELEERRAQFEFENQDRLEKRVRKAEAVLDKADSAPITDVTQSKEEIVKGKATSTKTKVKGINFSGYAALMNKTNETARQAITGVRADKNSESKPGAVQEVDGLIWTE